MAAWLGPLIGAGANLLGGLLGRRDARKARDQAIKDERLRFVRLRAAALRGGFDPLTVLRSGFVGASLPSGYMDGGTTAQIFSSAFGAAADAWQIGQSNRIDRARLDLDERRFQLDQVALAESIRLSRSAGFAPGGGSPWLTAAGGAWAAGSGGINGTAFQPGAATGMIGGGTVPLAFGLELRQGAHGIADVSTDPRLNPYGDEARDWFGMGQLAHDVVRQNSGVAGTVWAGLTGIGRVWHDELRRIPGANAAANAVRADPVMMVPGGYAGQDVYRWLRDRWSEFNPGAHVGTWSYDNQGIGGPM